MSRHIRKTAVIGAGVMGASIAAHLANAGIPVLLLDMVPKGQESGHAAVATLEKKQVRNQLADNAVKKIKKTEASSTGST